MKKEMDYVTIRFNVPADKAKHIFNATRELFRAGITFDTGGCIKDEKLVYDWEFDWSLEGGVEIRVKQNKLEGAVALDEISSSLSCVIGDTFIDFKAMSPYRQWRRIIRLLAEKGFLIRRI